MSFSAKKHLSLVGLTGSNLLGNGATFLIILFLSSHLQPSDFGIFTVATSFVMLGSTILDFGTGISLVKWYNTRNARRRIEYIHAAFVIRVGISLAFLAVATAFYFALAPRAWPQLEPRIVQAILLGVLAMSWWNFFRSRNQATKEYRLYALSTIALSVCRIVGVLLVVLQVDDPASILPLSLLALYTAAPLLVSAANIVAGRTRASNVRIHLDSNLRRKIKILSLYARWPLLSMILYPLVTNIPLWVLGRTHNLESAGAFGIGIYFANAISPLREALKIYVLPKVMELDSAGIRSYFVVFRQKFKLSLPLIAILSATALCAQYFINGDRYENAYIIIPVMIATQTITMFTSFIGPLLHYYKKPHIDTYINIFRAALSAALSFALIDRYGALGAVATSSFCVLLGEYFIYRYVQTKLMNHAPARPL